VRAPLVNIAETAEAFLVEVAAPGLTNPDFKIGINGTILSIAFTNRKCASGSKVYSQHEFNYCCFKKDIAIPRNVDSFFISATYAEGILSVHLPKTTTAFMHREDRIGVY